MPDQVLLDSGSSCRSALRGIDACPFQVRSPAFGDERNRCALVDRMTGVGMAQPVRRDRRVIPARSLSPSRW